MAQYQEGTVVVTNGSAVVTAVDPDPNDPNVGPPQQWSSEVSAGDLFIVVGDSVVYTVQSVDSNTQITLASSYQGSTVTPGGTPQKGVDYCIVRDFTQNYTFPLLAQGDVETATVLSDAMKKVDEKIKSLDDRITALGG